MSDRPLLLVSNDDGVDAAGIIALREALSKVQRATRSRFIIRFAFTK
jgi:hypothetical protein